jgi:ribose/xylose/arabinose/galactoside ABC-type transport system permease subunit
MAPKLAEPIGFLPYLPRAIALAVLAAISGFIVWSFHTVDWPAYLAALVIGGFLGLMVGGLVGVHLLPSLMAMLTFGGVFEGIYLGWSSYGWGGAILGGLIGLAAGPSVVLVPMMLIHFVLLLCGIDPMANLDRSQEEQKRE